MLRVVISNIIIRPQLTLLTNKCVYQFIEDQKSMISNLLNCRSLSTTFSYYASIKPFMLPRTTSLLSRRLVHLLIPINISYLQYRDKQIFKQIVQDIIHIEYKMLIPSECLSVLFFIYTLKDSLKRLQIDEQKLKKLELSLINQIMVNIESVNFNNLVDLVALFRNNEGSEENIKIIFKNLQKTFPLHESDQKDSFYHITRLLSIIVQQQKSMIAVLLKKVSDSIIKYDQYLPKYMLVDSINILLGKFSSLRIQPQLSESINLLLISLMTNLANKASMLEGAQFSHVVMCIKRLAKQIEEGNEVSKQSIANTAVEINKLKKIYYRQSQIRLTQKQKFYKLNPPNNPQDGNDFRLFKSKDSF